MVVRRLAAVAALMVWAGGAAAQEVLLVEAFVEVEPEVGTRVDVTTVAGRLRTIEWSREVEVRVRTPSGRPLTEVERAAARRQSAVCARGEPRALTDRLDFNGTLEISFQCVRLQRR